MPSLLVRMDSSSSGIVSPNKFFILQVVFGHGVLSHNRTGKSQWQGPDAAHQSRSQPKQREMNSYMLLACLVISLLLHLRAPYLGCGRAHRGLGLPVTISEDIPPRHKPTKINSSSLRFSFQQIPGCVKLPTTLRIIIWN